VRSNPSQVFKDGKGELRVRGTQLYSTSNKSGV
jgi:hypothetical protein